MRPDETTRQYRSRLLVAISSESDDELHELLMDSFDAVWAFFLMSRAFKRAKERLDQTLGEEKVGRFLGWMQANQLW